jgi:tetratricopeptide (TPR) repeat protein
VKYLGVANTQHIRFLAGELFPTEMSRQNILYHVRIAEDRGWIATFASALELNDTNKMLFRPRFIEELNEKISAQRFIVKGTEWFDPESEEKIITCCKKNGIKPIDIRDPEVISIITDSSIKRLSSIKEKASGNKSLFMVLLRYGWFWLNIDPKISTKIVAVIQKNEKKHNYNDHYEIDTKLLEIVSSIELETLPEVTFEDLRKMLDKNIDLAKSKKREDIKNIMAMTLVIIGRYLVSYNKLALAEEFMNRGIKYLRHTSRSSILMRKLQVDSLFDLAVIYQQQGWFYKALSVYENIERIINEDFEEKDPITNMKGRLELAKSELYIKMSWPSYVFGDDDYKKCLLKAIRFARKANQYYNSMKNETKVTEIALLRSWINALMGRIKISEFLLKKGVNRATASTQPRLNAIYHSARAEIYRKNNELNSAIKHLNQAISYYEIIGNDIAKLFCMTRAASLHVQLSIANDNTSIISYGNMSQLFKKEMSDMISHVFLEYNKFLKESKAIISFFVNDSLVVNHPEIANYAEYVQGDYIASYLLGESFTILPKHYLKEEHSNNGKITCITGEMPDDLEEVQYSQQAFSDRLLKLDEQFQVLLNE